MLKISLLKIQLNVLAIFIVSPLFYIPTHAQTVGPTITQVSDSGQTKKYEKFEVTFDITNTQASNFQFPYLSAADANQYLQKYIDVGISVNAEFTLDNWQTVYKQPAFYYQEFTEGTTLNYVYPLDVHHWKARFSPNASGTWKYRLIAEDTGGLTTSSEGSFTVVDSQNHGFVKVSKDDPRYFEFDDSTYFPATGYNISMNQLRNDAALQEMKDNHIQFVRAWLAPSNIFGSSWTAWEMMPGHYNGYLPRVPILPLEETPGQPMKLMWFLSQESTWYEQCAFLGHTQPSPNVKQNTTYHIRAKYKGNNITGPRDGGYSDYGFVIKIGGWQSTCEDPYKPGIDPGFANTTPVTNYGTDSNWNRIEGTWNSGNNTALPNFYIALENASGGSVYIDSIEVYEMSGGTVNNPVLTGANIIDKPSADTLSYFAQKPSYLMDRTVEKLEQYGIYVRPVILEKNDYVSGKTDVYGNPQFADSGDNFYGAAKRCTTCREYTAQRWLQDAWYRYIQARWGYSTAIHSWELLNEGDPDHWGHFAQTDEMGKYLKCRVFGVDVEYGDGDKCTYDHPNSHMTNTSFWHSFPVVQFWDNPKYLNNDYADVHAYISTSNGIDYTSPCSKAEMSYDAAAYHECHSRQYSGWNIGMPIVRGEAGMDVSGTQSSTILDIQQDTNGLWLHNYLWAELSPGGMIEQYWWVGEHVGSNKDEFRNYYSFISNLPLNKGGYEDIQANNANSNLRVWGQKNVATGNAHFWVQNKNHTWKNVVDSILIPAESADIVISGFNSSLTSITLEEWDTYTGTVKTTQTNYPVSNGSITITTSNLTSDIAYKIINPQSSTTGDLNNDNTVNIQDIIILINEIFTPSGVEKSDINNDGKVDILDVIALINIIFS